MAAIPETNSRGEAAETARFAAERMEALGLSAPFHTALARAVVRTLRDNGIGVLLVEHHTDFVFRICDRVTTLNTGKMICHGTSEQVRNDPEVIRVYLGA